MDDFFKIVSVWDIFVIKYVKLSKVLTWFLVCDNTLSGKGPNALSDCGHFTGSVPDS